MADVQDTLLTMPCINLKGVGEQSAKRLTKLNLHCVQDLLFHLPARYQNRSSIESIKRLKIGALATIVAEIITVEQVRGRRLALLCHLKDDSGMLTIRFFYFNRQQKQSFVPGRRIRCSGEVRRGPYGYEMVHPEYQLISMGEDPLASTPKHLMPIYPTTEGVTQRLLFQLTSQALRFIKDPQVLEDYLAKLDIPNKQRVGLVESLHYLHRPPLDAPQALLLAGRHPAQQRLALEELIAQQLSLRQWRAALIGYRSLALPLNQDYQQRLLTQLGFGLTDAQKRVVAEISADIHNEKPMLRLLQGDVGSGKTVVAALAMLQALASGHQVALMVPTELLAEQHAKNLSKWFAPFDETVGLLRGKMKASEKKQLLIDLASADIKLVVGTHALFQKNVDYKSLALVVIDEQHRFGVHQRLALWEKGQKNGVTPHQLIMTATPIPRTLAMTAYADLDCSVIDELPPGRTPVSTVAMADSRRLDVVNKVRQHCEQGKQVYWVCILIEESEVLTCQAAEVCAVELRELLPTLKIGLVHGRLSSADKNQMMGQFSAGDIDVLVATTVIEVGVDVPNASLMVIQNPERLGLSQLHQLRGRVGRGRDASHCVLLYQSPLSYHAKQRIGIMRETTDGFKIAQKDLLLRGPGEVLGSKQTGLLQLRVADLNRDHDLVDLAMVLVQQLESSGSTDLIKGLLMRWLATRQNYLNV